MQTVQTFAEYSGAVICLIGLIFAGVNFLDAREAAAILRMDSRTLIRWARLGQVPAHPLSEGKRKL
jgi:hypothetical protein